MVLRCFPMADAPLHGRGGREQDGRRRWDHARVIAQSLKTGERKTLVDGGADGRYVPTGHLVYALGGTLFAVPFNLAKLEVTGGACARCRRRASRGRRVRGHGSLRVFQLGFSGLSARSDIVGTGKLLLYDRRGGAEALKLPAGSYGYPRVSPDGKRLAFETSDEKETSVSIYELSGLSSVRRVTFGGNNRFPIWSADGQRVAFQSDRDGDRAVFWQSINGGTAERLTKPDPGTSHVPESWSPTGETLLFNVAKGSATSLWAFSVRDRKAMPFADVQSASFPTDAVFSPDGRWVAYQAGEASQGEAILYVQPFPPDGTKHQIARGGRPLWSHDGTELFYIPAAGEFRVVTVTTQPSFTFTNPVAVPRGFGIASADEPADIRHHARRSDCGHRVRGPKPKLSIRADAIQVVLNWFEELKARVPTK